MDPTLPSPLPYYGPLTLQHPCFDSLPSGWLGAPTRQLTPTEIRFPDRQDEASQLLAQQLQQQQLEQQQRKKEAKQLESSSDDEHAPAVATRATPRPGTPGQVRMLLLAPAVRAAASVRADALSLAPTALLLFGHGIAILVRQPTAGACHFSLRRIGRRLTWLLRSGR